MSTITSFFKKRSNPDKDTEAKSTPNKRQRKADIDPPVQVVQSANPKRIVVRLKLLEAQQNLKKPSAFLCFMFLLSNSVKWDSSYNKTPGECVLFFPCLIS